MSLGSGPDNADESADNKVASPNREPCDDGQLNDAELINGDDVEEDLPSQ